MKVIDACALNEKYWVFYAAGTNVGFTATVTDTLSGAAKKTYSNKDGVAGAAGAGQPRPCPARTERSAQRRGRCGGPSANS